jgi:citrate synthase
MTMLSMAILFL